MKLCSLVPAGSHLVPVTHLRKVGCVGCPAREARSKAVLLKGWRGGSGHFEQEGQAELSAGVCKSSVHSEAPEILEKCGFFGDHML